MRITFDMEPNFNNLRYFEDFILKINPQKAASTPSAPTIAAPVAPPVTVETFTAPAISTPVISDPVEEVLSTPVETYSLTDVRAMALKWSRAKKQKELAEIFATFGAKKLSDIPEDKYGELMKELVKIDG